MKQTTRVNLHCHSNISDGELPPEDLAGRLAAENVVYAALTDHDSIEGLFRFHETLERYNIGFVPGVEVTTQFQGRELHLLAYGFDLHHQELLDTLQFLRYTRLSRIQGPLRRMPSRHIHEPQGRPAPGVADTGQIEIKEAIALVHRASGKAFLAHPLTYETETEKLDHLLRELKSLGLDGIEAIFNADPDDRQQILHALSHKHELIICSGTDFHNTAGEDTRLWVEMDNAAWKTLVHSITSTPQMRGTTDSAGISNSPTPVDEEQTDSWPWPSLRPRIVLPSLVAIVLFVVSIWAMVLPSLETILIDRKRDTIRELTNTALSLLAEADREARAGILSLDAAQEKAKTFIGAIRYGKQGKDYFWIQDFEPIMILHPYRSDLNGKNVAAFTDIRGGHIFCQFAKTVHKKGHGFVEYVWQWQDDPEQLAAKESYVVGFEPWGWIIGTGMYIDDVNAEIAAIEKEIVYTLTGIVSLVFFLLLFNIRQSLLVERRKQAVQSDLRRAEQRYRALIEATTEGTLMVLDDRCRYANPTFLQMAGLSAERLELLELSDLFPRTPANEVLWRHLDRLPTRKSASTGFDALLACSDGLKRECIVSLNPIVFAGQPGTIVLVKDITHSVRHEKEYEAFIERLGVSLLFLQEPVASLGQPAISCLPETPIHKAAAMMNAIDLSCIVVETGEGIPVGLVTDHDFRERFAKNMDADITAPVRTIMTAPLVTIPEKAVVYEALMAMEEHKHQHIAVADSRGRITRLIRAMELLQFHRYGPVVLPWEIARATNVEQVRQYRGQLPSLVKALVQAGAQARIVARMTATVCDAATYRFIALSIQELGPPPVPFAFIAMGSQGRQEQTLLTDQDNAIIYQCEQGGQAKNAVSQYFLNLGRKVCMWLNRAGYPFCNGNVMADNAKWCLSLTEWKENLAEWILKAEPKELLDLSICLDFRTVYGAGELTDALRVFLYQTLKERPRFLPHLAQNVLLFKPPARLLGKIIKTGGPREEAGRLNVKEVLMPLIGCGRLYALHYRMPQTHTLERIESLIWKGRLHPSTWEAIKESYNFLMRLRFQAQLIKIQEGRPMDNCIELDKIKPMDEAFLKQAFVQIELLQKKITYDFLGGI